MNQVEIQAVYVSPFQPEASEIQKWVDAALFAYSGDTELVVRIVDEDEGAELNQQYRQKEGPTNIISFPYDLPPEVNLNLLGDLVICAPVVEKEALSQGKTTSDHWAHILIHGVLHLLGYDHLEQDEAEEMEAMEISILQQLNISNPYL